MAGPFLCRGDFPLGGLDGLVAELAQLQGDLCHWLDIPPGHETVEIYLFRDESSYRRYLRTYFPQIPYRRALYVKCGGPGMVFAFRSKDIETDLRHECTHALLHAALPRVPLWLDEGLATYFENPREKRAFESRHLTWIRWWARFGIVPSLEKLEKQGDLSQMRAGDYRNAWAWVHFALHGPAAAHEELVGMLRDLGEGSSPGLLSQRLTRRLGNADHAFATHFKGWSP